MSDGRHDDPDYETGYDYEAEDEEYYTYDATDEDDEGGRRPLVFLTIVALLVVFAGVVFFAYKQGLKQGAAGNPPVIRADSSPTKVAPTNPGGMEIPHQDRTVYDRISGAEPAGPDAEHLLPSPEEPLPVTKNSPPVTQQELPPAGQPAPPAAVSTAQPAETIQSAPAAPVAPQAPVAAAPPAKTEEQPSAAAVASSGGYVGQLAAFRDEPSARAEFKKLQAKFPMLANYTADIQKADLGEKGIYYRLRAGYMDKIRAQELCTALKAQGQACLVRPR